MAARFLSAVSLGVILALAIPEPASAGELRLTFQNGRVMLLARDVPLPQILAEWERVGGTRIVNRDGTPGSLVTLDLVDVPEARALATLLRPVAGYLATARSVPSETASQFARIIIMPGAASPAVASLTREGAQPLVTTPSVGPGGTQIQRRVMPDGRVVNFMEDPQRPVEISVADDEQDAQPPPVEAPVMMMRAPGQMPQFLPPGQPPGSPQGQAPAVPFQANPPGVQRSGNPRPPTMGTVPSVPGTPMNEQGAQPPSVDAPVMVRMPGQLPQLVPPGQPPGSPQDQAPAVPFQANPPGVQSSGNQMPATMGTVPIVVGTATTPGTVIPGPPTTPPPYRPQQYVPQTPPPSPPKPPGI